MKHEQLTAKRQARTSERARDPGAVGAVKAEPSRDALATYMGGLQAYGMLDARQEIELAQRIEELELAHWTALLRHAPALETLLGALAAHMELPKEARKLRKLASATAARRSDAAWKRAVEVAAARVRERDVARVALADADAKVRAAFSDQRGSKAYLQRVDEARRAQQSAKNEFMTANLRLVVSLARRYETSLMPLADLIQEGNLGLMRAVERFDHRRGFRFSTYAGWWIRHGLSRALSDKARLVRLPVHLLEDAQRATRAAEALLRVNSGRAPTQQELAEASGLSEDKLGFVQLHASAGPPTSFDKKLGDDGEASLLDVTADNSQVDLDEALDGARWSQGVGRLLELLPPIEADILRYRFGLDDAEELTLHEVGAKYNLSRERIRQLQEQALERLRAELARESEQKRDKQSAA